VNEAIPVTEAAETVRGASQRPPSLRSPDGGRPVNGTIAWVPTKPKQVFGDQFTIPDCSAFARHCQDDVSPHGFSGDLSNMLREPGGVRLGAVGLFVSYLQGPAAPIDGQAFRRARKSTM
jgi:hypothetical protein